MSRIDAAGPPGLALPPPFRFLLAGAALSVVALVSRFGAPPWLAALAAFAAATVAGVGLAQALRQGSSPVLAWLMAAFVAGVGGQACAGEWGSLTTPLTVAAVVCAFGAGLAAMPVFWRRLVLSLFIFLHVGAIALGVVVVPPPAGPSPWLPAQLWTRYARHYLMFFNINNGYHFYSPDPGPTMLLWFRVEFDDGASRWVRWPDHGKVRGNLERRRWGALASVVAQGVPIPPEAMEERLRERRKLVETIPFAPTPEDEQYREPTLEAKMLLESYARYVARNTAHPLGEKVGVKGTKIYRVEYHNPSVQHFHAGREPLDPTLYKAYYSGEFAADGKIKPSSLRVEFDDNGVPKPKGRTQDPLLYWLIPIIKYVDEKEAAALPKGPDGAPAMWAAEGRVVNYVRIHAGDPGEESVP
jgi:hypothetical protein